MSKKRIVVVLGMHRSGTSTITRGLKALSVELGDNLMPAITGNNDKGFWEDLDVNRLNEHLLAKAESAWDRLALFDPVHLCGDQFAAERYEAAALIEKQMSGHAVHGYKDPRLSILLPFWKCVFEDLGIEENYIIALRNPIEVALSLKKRDKLHPISGHSLWLKHTWAAIKYSEGKRRLGVSYARILSNPAEELARIATAFDLPLPRHSDPSVIEYLSEFITPELRHNRIPDNELSRSENIPAVIPSLYSILTEWSAASPDQQLEIPAKLKSQVESFWAPSRPLLVLADALTASASKNAAEAIAAEKARIALSKSFDELNALLPEKDKVIEESRRTSRELQELLETREKRISEANAEVESTKTQLAEGTKKLDLLEAARTIESKERIQSEAALAGRIAAMELRVCAAEAEATTARAQSTEESQKRREAEAALAKAKDGFTKEIQRNNRLESRLDQAGGEIQSLSEREAAVRLELVSCKQSLIVTESDYRASLAQLGEVVSSMAATEAALQDARNQVQALTDREAAASEMVLALEASIRSLKDEIAAKTKTSRLLRHEVHSLRSSTSWRVTKPIRMMSTLLTYPRRILYRLAGKDTRGPPSLGD